MSKQIRIRLSGIVQNNVTGDSSAALAQPFNHDIRSGRLNCQHIWAVSDYDADFTDSGLRSEFEDCSIVNDALYKRSSPIAINYTQNGEFRLSKEQGITPLTDETNQFSFYRREYELVGRYGDSTPTTIKGEWEPVAVNIGEGRIRDYNISNDRSYQYIMYPNDGSQIQQFANGDLEAGTANKTGEPVKVKWQEWCLMELEPIDTDLNIPILQRAYKVDANNIWLFKYGLEAGSQSQNLTKNEFKTLGQFSKFGYGQTNYVSGDVSCYLGSEIIPYTKDHYYERLWKGISDPGSLSTNQKVDMLNKWRSVAFSKNPKLLQDMKGQSWIVQIVSSSNSTKSFYKNQPDTISFSWKQIADPKNCIIYGAGETVAQTGVCGSEWVPWSQINK